MNPNEVNVNLTLTINEVNTILRSLGKHPFDEISALIQKIKLQGESEIEKLFPEKQVAEPQS